jgi:glycosyl-4,4'-diaponeurosporenoate acyltransferase
MKLIGYTANILGWPILQLTIGFAVTHFPDRLFGRDCWLTASRAWEDNGEFYAGRLAIRRWKHLLPDGSSWFGGFPKRKLISHHTGYLARFVTETRRSEIAHWCMLCCFPLFFPWNPTWACLVMGTYGLAANLPCIIVQRYNRLVLLRILTMRFEKKKIARHCGVHR